MENSQEIIVFYNSVVSKKKFILPLLGFAIVAYSFSLYNRTISYDDLMREHYYGVMLSGRWGMCFWQEILGMLEFDPFVDRFVSLCFYVITAISVCFLLFSISKDKNTLSYTLFASAFITYPLINEIWEYGVANFVLTGGLLLSTIAAIVLRKSESKRRKILLASLLLLLPVSSYESAAFYYLALVCMIVFYENYADKQKSMTIKEWWSKMILYITPVIIAVLLRFSISFVLNTINGLTYSSGGATGIGWFSTQFSIVHVVMSAIVHSIVDYVLNALVYLPILLFFVTILIFGYLIISSKRKSVVFLGLIFIMSLFSQSFVQCAALPYRNAQSITLFVAFVIYIISQHAENYRSYLRYAIYIVLLGVCWHQSVYLNRILCLNNLRSDNELAIIRQIGENITSNFEKKPVVFVSPYHYGPWIEKQVSVDESTWNGRLFYTIHDKIKKLRRPYKYIATNINSSTGEYPQIDIMMRYCGFSDIDIIKPRPNPHSKEYSKKDLQILNEAISIAKEKNIKPYQVYDNGGYLIVNMGGLFFKEGFSDDNPYAEE